MIPTDHHRPHRVPETEIAQRIVGFQSFLREEGIPLAWLEHLTDRLYLGGSIQNGVLLVPAEGQAVFYARRSFERARAESPLEVRRHPGRAGLIAELPEISRGAPGIGLALDVAPGSTALLLHERTGVPPVDVAPRLRLERSCKSVWEVEQIRRAAEQYTRAMQDVDEWLHAGLTELEVTAGLESRLRELGHGGTIRVRRPGADITMAVVVSGDSALYPTGFDGPVGATGPSPAAAAGGGWKRLESGETVMFDVVTSFNGYHADTTRTFFVGDAPAPGATEAHDFCRRVLARIEERMYPGALCSEIYRDVALEAREAGEPEGFMGYGENRVRFFGHGVGLELDELPVLADRVDLPLAEGMVLAVEPKAFLRGIGPVGVENTYVITRDGCESLCPMDDTLRGHRP